MRSQNKDMKKLPLQWLKADEQGAAKGPILLLLAIILVIGTGTTFYFLKTGPAEHAQGDLKTGHVKPLKVPASTDVPKNKNEAKNNKNNPAKKNLDSRQIVMGASAKETAQSNASVISGDKPVVNEQMQLIQRDSSPHAKKVTAIATRQHDNPVRTRYSKPVTKPVPKPVSGNSKPGINNQKPGIAIQPSAAQKPESFDEMIARARNSLFTVFNVRDFGNDDYTILQGSSFLYNNKGYLVTNGHVVEGAKTVGIVATDGRKYTGTVVGFSYKPDVALIHVPKLSGAKTFPIDQKNYAINTPVAAIANNLSVKTTKGKIIENNLDMQIDPNDPYSYPNMYVTTASTPPGFSGGPLIATNTKKIIGINSLHNLTEDKIGYSMPFNQVENLVQSWSKKPMTEKQIATLYKNPDISEKKTALVKKKTKKKETVSQTKADEKVQPKDSKQAVSSTVPESKKENQSSINTTEKETAMKSNADTKDPTVVETKDEPRNSSQSTNLEDADADKEDNATTVDKQVSAEQTTAITTGSNQQQTDPSKEKSTGSEPMTDSKTEKLDPKSDADDQQEMNQDQQSSASTIETETR